MEQSLEELAPISAVLLDDRPVLLRPIEESDYERVRMAFEMLSDESRLNRFWQKPRELSGIWAERLTQMEAGDHLTWVTLNPLDFSFPGCGGASIWFDEADPSRAEISFTIGDPWQRSGLATILFSILYHEAWIRDIRLFHGYTRLANEPMVNWWRSIGGEVKRSSRQYELTYSLEEPRQLINRVSYEMMPAFQRVEAANWLREWLQRLKQG